ncbi:ABC transporter ATP-binding protein [bacterium]|nr:ABC transporter ATP-binding protein [bacterium]
MIKLEKIQKYYGEYHALRDISCNMVEGEFFSLLGPSGSGKTTLLRTIAGFEHPDSGDVSIDGQSMAKVPPNKRPTNMVFQSYAIFPHMNVAENVAFGLRSQGINKTDQLKLVRDTLAKVDLAGYEDRAAHAMSGGQRQRVALARALILKPKVLLLDEPLSALDRKLREEMQSELRRLQRSLGITFVLVTHDQEEALTMSDRVAVMFEGRIAQLDTPETLYRHPASKRVAEFFGSMNVLPAKLIDKSIHGQTVGIDGLGPIEVPENQLPEKASESKLCAGVRPESMTILEEDDNTAEKQTEGVITDVEYRGEMTYYDVRFEGTEKLVCVSMRNTTARKIKQVGDAVRIGWGRDSVVLLIDQ